MSGWTESQLKKYPGLRDVEFEVEPSIFDHYLGAISLADVGLDAGQFKPECTPRFLTMAVDAAGNYHWAVHDTQPILTADSWSSTGISVDVAVDPFYAQILHEDMMNGILRVAFFMLE